MKILIYGAGMTGSILASQLERNGQKVTILARGSRAEAIRSFGIVTHPLDGADYYTAHPAVIETLAPEDDFDVILVTLRRNQHQEVLPILAQNQHFQKVVFLGNNLGSGVDLLEHLPEEKVAIGFVLASGEKRGDIIYYYTNEKTSRQGNILMCESDPENKQRASAVLLQLKAVLENAGFETKISSDIHTWLKNHAALVLPLAFGLYLCDGNNYRLAKTRDALLMSYRGIKEGIRVLRRLRIPILSKKFLLFLWVPEPIGIALLRKVFSSEFTRISIAAHANNAKDEMYFLAEEFKSLIKQSGVETPTLNQLFAVIEQTDPGLVILPEGSHSKPLDWKPVWIAAGIVTGIIGALGYLFSQRKRKP